MVVGGVFGGGVYRCWCGCGVVWEMALVLLMLLSKLDVIVSAVLC